MFLVFFGVAPSHSSGSIVVMEIPNVTERDGSGLYDKVLARILNTSGLDVPVVYLPINRAIKDFENGKYSCVYPIGLQGITSLGKPSETVNFFSYQLFSLHHSYSTVEAVAAGNYSVNALDFDETKRLADQQGLDVDFYIDSNNSLAKMLALRHTDFVFAISPDFPLAFEEMYGNSKLIPIGEPLDKTQDGFICSEDDSGTKLLQHINKVLKEMDSRGELKQIFGSLYERR